MLLKNAHVPESTKVAWYAMMGTAMTCRSSLCSYCPATVPPQRFPLQPAPPFLSMPEPLRELFCMTNWNAIKARLTLKNYHQLAQLLQITQQNELQCSGHSAVTQLKQYAGTALEMLAINYAGHT